VSMNERQRFAIANPLNSARDRAHVIRHRYLRERGDKTLLVIVLAVDR